MKNIVKQIRDITRRNPPAPTESKIVVLADKAADRIEALERAIERMRVAGGSHEFQMAFELAKDLIE